MSKIKIRIGDIVQESIVDVPGIRTVVFTQEHDPNGGREVNVKETVDMITRVINEMESQRSGEVVGCEDIMNYAIKAAEEKTKSMNEMAYRYVDCNLRKARKDLQNALQRNAPVEDVENLIEKTQALSWLMFLVDHAQQEGAKE